MDPVVILKQIIDLGLSGVKAIRAIRASIEGQQRPANYTTRAKAKELGALVKMTEEERLRQLNVTAPTKISSLSFDIHVHHNPQTEGSFAQVNRIWREAPYKRIVIVGTPVWERL